MYVIATFNLPVQFLDAGTQEEHLASKNLAPVFFGHLSGEASLTMSDLQK